MWGVPRVPRSIPVVRNFDDTPTGAYQYYYSIALQAVDGSGTPLPGAIVSLFRTVDNSFAGLAVTDANGNFRLAASQFIQHYLVAYLTGSPDLAGTSVNTLVGT